MRVAVPVSGVIGTTTAWYAAKTGHEVTVVPSHGIDTELRTQGRWHRKRTSAKV